MFELTQNSRSRARAACSTRFARDSRGPCGFPRCGNRPPGGRQPTCALAHQPRVLSECDHQVVARCLRRKTVPLLQRSQFLPDRRRRCSELARSEVVVVRVGNRAARRTGVRMCARFLRVFGGQWQERPPKKAPPSCPPHWAGSSHETLRSTMPALALRAANLQTPQARADHLPSSCRPPKSRTIRRSRTTLVSRRATDEVNRDLLHVCGRGRSRSRPHRGLKVSGSHEGWRQRQGPWCEEPAGCCSRERRSSPRRVVRRSDR